MKCSFKRQYKDIAVYRVNYYNILYKVYKIRNVFIKFGSHLMISNKIGIMYRIIDSYFPKKAKLELEWLLKVLFLLVLIEN